jgi:hypothetical protein
MAQKVRRLEAPVRLSRRVLDPIERLARLSGVSASDIVEYILTELFEGDVTDAATASTPPPEVAPERRRRSGPGRTNVISIARARGRRTRDGRRDGHDMAALRRTAEHARERARVARRHAGEACRAAEAARERASAIEPPV